MSDTVDCQVFQDQLEALVAGNLPPEAVSHLRAHAAVCTECGLQLKVHNHLTDPSLRELEENVPQEHLNSMWAGVQPRLSKKEGPQPRPLWGRRTQGWLLPTLAAASLILLVVSGTLLAKLRRAESAVDLLAERLEVVSASSFSAQAMARPGDVGPALADRSPWLGALDGQDRISVDGLREFLLDLPGNPILLDKTQLRNLRRVQPALAPLVFRDVLGELTGLEAVRARDLLRILNASDLDPDLSVPTARLIELLS